jgi:hypothetical protein
MHSSSELLDSPVEAEHHARVNRRSNMTKSGAMTPANVCRFDCEISSWPPINGPRQSLECIVDVDVVPDGRARRRRAIDDLRPTTDNPTTCHHRASCTPTVSTTHGLQLKWSCPVVAEAVQPDSIGSDQRSTLDVCLPAASSPKFQRRQPILKHTPVERIAGRRHKSPWLDSMMFHLPAPTLILVGRADPASNVAPAATWVLVHVSSGPPGSKQDPKACSGMSTHSGTSTHSEGIDATVPLVSARPTLLGGRAVTLVVRSTKPKT